jgi:hypothetical protein
MCEHANLAAMVRFVGEHVGEHFDTARPSGADGPGFGPAVAEEVGYAAGVIERFNQHLGATGCACGERYAGLAGGAVRAAEPARDFRCGAESRIHLVRMLCMWVKIWAMVRTLPGGRAVHRAG